MGATGFCASTGAGSGAFGGGAGVAAWGGAIGVATCAWGSAAAGAPSRVANQIAPAIANAIPPQTKAECAARFRGIDEMRTVSGSENEPVRTLVNATRSSVTVGLPPLREGGCAGTLIGSDTGVGAAIVGAHATGASPSAVTRAA